MNILHVIPGLTWERGGPSAVVRALARHQLAAGHRVVVLTTDQGERSGERPVELPAGVAVERLRVRGPDRLAYAPAFARALRARLASVEVVHAHSVFTHPVHVALREAVAVEVPVVLRPCGLLHRYSLARSRLQKLVYLALWGHRVRKACSAWHFTSANEARESWPWDESPRFIVPNGIDPAEFILDPDAARVRVGRLLPALAGGPYVLFLGRLHAKKRLDLLLSAFLRAAPTSFRFIVAGPDSAGLWEPLARRFLRDPAAANRVLRIGTVTGAAKAALLAGASLFALPSEHENFGVAALEALAAGTPVLLSPHVDLAEAAVAAGVGYQAALEAGAWQEALGRLLADPAALRDTARRAQPWVGEHYTWGRINECLTRCYQWVIAGCPAATAGAVGPGLVPAAACPK